MTNTLSPAATASANAESTDEVWLVLITISHASLVDTEGNPTPIRVVNDFNNLTSRGELYVGLPFQIMLPDDDQNSQSVAQLKVDNVDQTIVAAVRGLGSYATCDIEIILASQPDTVELGYYDLQMRSADYDQLYVTAQLTFEQVYTEPIALDQTPARFPGMFAVLLSVGLTLHMFAHHMFA